MGAQLRLRSFFLRRISTHFQMFPTALMTSEHCLTNAFTLSAKFRNATLLMPLHFLPSLETLQAYLLPTTFLTLSAFHHSDFELQFSLFQVGTTTLLFSLFIDIIIEKHGKMFDNTKQINYFCIYSQRQITT